ncbi:hypothetical protein BDA96_08G123900 [Sorghum bicolor]|uniref:CCHC-type domain-containing protein n=1 Tax=Sorghum bicolor TaxID=4558 RepID=A0A921U6W7_SORBI|nr:hypothetical protein BDA96_08G123900 [Sorghum bicolor]
MEPKPGRWVWQEDGLQAHAQGKGVVAGKLSEDKGGAAELMEGMDVDISMEAEEGRDGDVAGRGNGRCSRCSKKGHAAGDCNAEVYCVICDSQDHMNHKCPLLKAPRPVAHAAGYAVMGLGFYHIPHPPLPRTKKDSKMARVSVMGGSLSADQLVLQLRRVVPVKWNWELKEVGEGEFLTQFPSKSELHRSIAYGRADAKGEGVPEGIRMQFEEWHEKEAFCYPRVLDVVIGDHYFDLEFEVEKKGFDEKGEEVEVEWDGGHGEGDGEGKGQDPNREGGWNIDQVKPRDDRRNKGFGGEDKRRGHQSENDVPINEHVLSKEEFEEFLRWKASKVLDDVVEEVLEDLADNVMKEPVEPMEGATVIIGLAETNCEEMVEGGEQMEAKGGITGPQFKELGEIAKAVTEGVGEKSSSVLEVAKTAGTKLVEAALIKEVVHSPTRASPRLAAVVTEHTLARAERLVQTKNLECNKVLTESRDGYARQTGPPTVPAPPVLNQTTMLASTATSPSPK